MSEAISARPPIWFWILAVFGLLFEAMGVWTYLVNVGLLPHMMDPNTPEQAIADAAPSWATALYAIAVFAGLVGVIGLLLRKRWARSLLILSLVACAAQFAWWIFLSGALQQIGPSIAVAPVIILLIATLLAWLGSHAVKRGWLS